MSPSQEIRTIPANLAAALSNVSVFSQPALALKRCIKQSEKSALLLAYIRTALATTATRSILIYGNYAKKTNLHLIKPKTLNLYY